MFKSVQTAAAEMRGEKVTYRAIPVVVEVAKPATANPAAAGTSKDFQFVTPLATIEEFDPLAATIKKSDGVLDVSGNERSITIKWDAAKLDETKVRTILTNSGHPVR